MTTRNSQKRGAGSYLSQLRHLLSRGRRAEARFRQFGLGRYGIVICVSKCRRRYSVYDLGYRPHGYACDYIKMDIEGYEKEALLGAASYLRDRETILAISAYHRPDDFFAIPLCIQELCGGYGFFRKHYANLFDTVYYHF